MRATAIPRRDPRDRGILVLSLTEACERFSFYGMQTLLMLYLIHSLLLPENAAQVVGLSSFRALLSHVFGTLSDLGFASELAALYSSLVYFTPILGGMVGDRLLGQRRAVLAGALLMAAGHVLMIATAGFLGALGLLIVGSGLLKGNISAQVGNLYREDEPEPRARAFTLFNVGVNIGALSGPFVCGAMAQEYGWHMGFATSGAMMIVSVLIYVFGRHALPSDVRRIAGVKAPPLTRADRRHLGLIGMVMFTGLFYSVTFFQLTDMYLIWIDHHVRRSFFGHQIPTNWFSCLDASFTVIGSPFIIWAIGRLVKHGREPGAIGKIMAATVMNACAWLVLAYASTRPDPVNPLWCLLTSGMLGVSYILQWPPTLALVSTLAPPQLRSTLMGVAFLTLFLAFNIVGWVGQFYEHMAPWQFWVLQTAIALAGVPCCVLMSRVPAASDVPGVGLMAHAKAGDGA